MADIVVVRLTKEAEMAKNGGSAFPVLDHEKLMFHTEPGMSLRDWFAGQAIHAAERSVNQTIGLFDEIAIAEKAYWLADAMLAQREKAK